MCTAVYLSLLIYLPSLCYQCNLRLFPQVPHKTPLYCTSINIPEARPVFLRKTIFLLHIRRTPLSIVRLFVVTGDCRLQAESVPIPNHSKVPVNAVSFKFFVFLFESSNLVCDWSTIVMSISKLNNIFLFG